MVDFQSLYDFLLEFGEGDVMVIGDCSARVGDTQLLEVEPELLSQSVYATRCATDNIIDSNGRKFIEMCEHTGLTALNGRFKSGVKGN